MRGKFITIEGVEGVGKSTSTLFIQTLLEAESVPFITTREPGGTVLGERIRELLLDKTQQPMSDTTELLLMFAARAQHLEQLIKPALEKGQWVICDRFTDSSYAYQGGGRHLPEDLIQQLEGLAIDNFTPDCTLLLDLPVEVGLKRAANVGEKDRFESEQVEFFDRVRQVFLDRASHADRYHVVDASRPLDQVQAQIRQLLLTLMGLANE